MSTRIVNRLNLCADTCEAMVKRRQKTSRECLFKDVATSIAVFAVPSMTISRYDILFIAHAMLSRCHVKVNVTEAQNRKTRPLPKSYLFTRDIYFYLIKMKY